MKYLESELHRIYQLQKINKNLYLPPNIYKLHTEAQYCYICHKLYTENNYKVRDHNHLTGEYRDAAHNRCNLNIRQKPSLYA